MAEEQKHDPWSELSRPIYRQCLERIVDGSLPAVIEGNMAVIIARAVLQSLAADTVDRLSHGGH